MSQVRFDGVKFTLGGTDYIVPPLTLKQLRKLRPELALMRQVEGNDARFLDDDVLDAVCTIALTSLQRNYPEMDVDTLTDLVDVTTVGPLIQAVMGVSGVEKAKPGEASAPA
jgi:hypothetical protein